MRLAQPATLLLLLLAAPLVWAWLRRPPLARRVVSSLLLLRALPGVSRRRRHIVDGIGLMLLVGTLVAGTLGLGLASGPPPVPWIAVVDGGPGMAARTEDGRTRAARARAALLAEIGSRPGSPVTLVSNAPPAVLTVGEVARDRVLSALDGHPPGEVGDVEPLLAALCADSAVLRWFGDDPPPEVGCSAARVDVGTAQNGGLVEVTMRQVDRLGTVQVQALSVGDAPVQADGGEGAPIALEDGLGLLANPGGGMVTVSIPSGDALALDDGVQVELPAAVPLRVGLLTDRPLGFTATALQAHPGLALQVGVDAASMELPLDLLVVETPGAGGLPEAPRVVLLGVDAPALGVLAGRAFRPDAVQPSRSDDPILQHMHLDGIRIPLARALQPPAGGRAVVLAGDVPVLVEGPARGGRIVALGFDPAASDLPLRVDYVHLVANLVRWADPTPGVVHVAGLPGAAETAPAVSESVAPASPRPPAVGWWTGAILGLCLLCAESLRSLLGGERPA